MAVNENPAPMNRGGSLDECPQLQVDTDSTHYPHAPASLAWRSLQYAVPALFFGLGVASYFLLSRRVSGGRTVSTSDSLGSESSLDASRKRFGDDARDRIDEGSWESFPASDPPS